MKAAVGGGGGMYYSHSLFWIRINLAAIHKQYVLNISGGGQKWENWESPVVC